MSNYKHTFVPGYSKKKRNELESTGRLTPKHALSSEYLLRLLDKIEPLEGKEVSTERIVTILLEQAFTTYEILYNAELRQTGHPQ